MSEEHSFPMWLIERARITKGIYWAGKKGVDPRRCVIPLCAECNQLLGKELESPTAYSVRELESGKGLTDNQCEILVRWLWKAEGILWCGMHPSEQYSQLLTLKERALGAGFANIKPGLVLAVALIKPVDGKDDLPMGFDSPVGGQNSIFVSGVFCNTAIMVCLRQYEFLIPPMFSRHHFVMQSENRDENIFFPDTTVLNHKDAVEIASKASAMLWIKHEEQAIQWASEAIHIPGVRKARVELPTQGQIFDMPSGDFLASIPKSLLRKRK